MKTQATIMFLQALGAAEFRPMNNADYDAFGGAGPDAQIADLEGISDFGCIAIADCGRVECHWVQSDGAPCALTLDLELA